MPRALGVFATTGDGEMRLTLSPRPRIPATTRRDRCWAKRLANYCCRECGKPRKCKLQYRCRKCQDYVNRMERKRKRIRQRLMTK